MKKWILKLSLLTAIINSIGCVEFKNPDDEQPKEIPTVQTLKAETLLVDEPLYLYDGQFLNEVQMKQKSENLPSSKSYLFIYDEIQISDRGALYTMGHNVQIKTAHLISDNGIIATFPKDLTASQGKNGRSGGHIFLNIEKAQGLLNIELRGENGGQGLPGNDPDNSLRGAYGKENECVGEPGKQGYRGKPGYDGGDSGTLEIKTTNEMDFSAPVNKYPGQKGKGGIGGKGGERGLGGPMTKPGAFCLNLKLPPALEDQSRGPVGDPGPDGQDGQKQLACRTKNGVTNCN